MIIYTTGTCVNTAHSGTPIVSVCIMIISHSYTRNVVHTQKSLSFPQRYLKLHIMILIWMLIVLALTGLGTADLKLLENVPVLPPGWKILKETPDPNQGLKLSFALRQPEMNSIKDMIGAGLNDGGIYLSHQ